ncbi:MAG: acetyl-CoA carboxylase biotin carboxyl carrier protein subunit [Bacteriovoracaceae bacterium]|nr:acetyl-CoA carboxylase biotin carboxyl carrier protein subunit [Bacteriovoracaceae bacterium]
MRYYIINSDGKEVYFDVSSVTPTQSDAIGFEVKTEKDGVKNYYVRSLAGKNYISQDMISWEKAPKISNAKGIVNINESLNVYRGFKPSGLGQASAGTLVTDMPGKVVKLLTAEGAVVSQGDTLLILEAMKMENEIKAGVDGVVKIVNVKEGQNLESGHLMIEIEE